MQINSREELKKFVRETLRKIKENSASAGAGAFLTPAAFAPSNDEDDAGKKALDADVTYTVKPAKEKKNFIKLHELSYKQFKEDQSMSDVQKVNKAILEINRNIREINRALDHSMKLKNESQMSNQSLWKRTNEALQRSAKQFLDSNQQVIGKWEQDYESIITKMTALTKVN